MAAPPIYVTPSGTAHVGGTPPRFPLVTRPVAPLSIPRTGGPSVPEIRNVRGTVVPTPTVPVRPPVKPPAVPTWRNLWRGQSVTKNPLLKKAGPLAAPFYGMDVQKRYRAVIQKLNPDSPLYDPELAAVLDEDVRKFGREDKGLLGRMGQTVMDPVGAASALLQGVVGVGKELLDKPAIDPMGQGVKKDIAEEIREASAKLRRGRESAFKESLEGAPHDLTPRAFTQPEFADEPRYTGEGPTEQEAVRKGIRAMPELDYFYGRAGDTEFADAEKAQVMRIEGLRAERKDRKPRSYEEVQEDRKLKGAKKAEMYWGEEDRADYAEMAKNEPDKLRSWFDKDQSGTLDKKERRLIFHPKLGFRARLAGERKKAFDQWGEDLWEEAEAAVDAEDEEARRIDSFMDDADALYDEQAAAADEEAKRKKQQKQQKRQTRKDTEATAAQLKKNRISFAKGLESDFGYSDAPSSAFQNPETRVRLMEEAYARAEELGVGRPQLRRFLREKGIMDEGFSESYEDFYKRNTSGGGGGLQTGSVGGRTTVGRGPKTETGGIKTQEGRAAKEYQRRYTEFLAQQQIQQMQQMMQPQASQYRPNPISRQFFGGSTYK
jgi:hypothetical protein